MGFLLAAASALAVEIRVATFNVGAHFGVEYFDYSLGDPGTPDHETVRAILQRIDADVVALQEIHTADLEGSPNDLQALATALGYTHVYLPPLTDAFDPIFRTVFLSRFPFLSSAAIGSPPGAREITRLHPAVRVDVPGIDNDPLLISPHLKAGTNRSDRFRRAVEMRRLTGHLASFGFADDDNFIILGDFNPSSINTTFESQPSGLPGSFVLGSDIAFPVSYHVNPAAYFLTPAAVKLDALQPDGSPSTFNTTTSGGPALDLILVSPAIAARDFATEIYNSALDTIGGGLPKVGSPLAAGTSATASDHYAVFADLELDPPEPYGFAQVGESIVENFDGFTGSRAPSPWIAGGGAWLGSDDGSSKLPGWRAYGAAPGFLTGGAPAVISARFENRSQTPLTALEISLDAEQWRAVSGGAADRMAVELVTADGTIPLPGLGFTASQELPTGPMAGGAPVRLSAMASGLQVPPGGSFDLRVSFLPGAGGGPAPDDVFINEFHYDNTGADTGGRSRTRTHRDRRLQRGFYLDEIFRHSAFARSAECGPEFHQSQPAASGAGIRRSDGGVSA